MAERYYTKKQEAFFQPCRIRILEDSTWSRYTYSSRPRYYAVVQDMITNQVVEWWCAGRGYIGGEWDKDRGQPCYYKKDALVVAKREAQTRKLAFNPKADVVKYDEVVSGPVRFCLSCGEQLAKRGYEPVLCRLCEADIVAGQHVRTERQLYLIHLIGLLAEPYIRVAEDTSRRLATQLLQVAGVQVGARWERYGTRAVTVVDTIGCGSRNEYDRFVVSLTAAQAEAMQAINELVMEFGQAWREHGREAGSSLLRRLASGEMHPNDFAAKREGLK